MPIELTILLWCAKTNDTTFQQLKRAVFLVPKILTSLGEILGVVASDDFKKKRPYLMPTHSRVNSMNSFFGKSWDKSNSNQQIRSDSMGTTFYSLPLLGRKKVEPKRHSKNTPTYPWSIPQESLIKPPNERNSFGVWGMFQGYVGKFLETTSQPPHLRHPYVPPVVAGAPPPSFLGEQLP